MRLRISQTITAYPDGFTPTRLKEGEEVDSSLFPSRFTDCLLRGGLAEAVEGKPEARETKVTRPAETKPVAPNQKKSPKREVK